LFPETSELQDQRDRIDLATLRAAIDGSALDVQKLSRRLHCADRLAGEQARSCAKTLGHTRRSPIENALLALLESIQKGFHRR